MFSFPSQNTINNFLELNFKFGIFPIKKHSISPTKSQKTDPQKPLPTIKSGLLTITYAKLVANLPGNFIFRLLHNELGSFIFSRPFHLPLQNYERFIGNIIGTTSF